MACNHWVTWPLITLSHFKLRTSYHNFHEDAITKLGWNTCANKMIPWLYVMWFIIAPFLYSYMSFLFALWPIHLLKLHSAISKKTMTTKLGGNTYKNERVTYLHMTWVNHTKVIKASAPKVDLMKGTNLKRPRDFWLYDTLTNEKSIYNFYKSC